MAYFTSNLLNTVETQTIIQDFLGGAFNNYIIPSFEFTTILSVKQAGSDIQYSVEDINNDGILEVVVGAVTGYCLISYNITDVVDIYQETKEVTIFSDGIPNNYLTTKNFPITSLNYPSSGTIEGSYKNIVRVGSMTGRITVDYIYDSGEINTIANKIKKIEDESIDLRNAIISQYTNRETLQKELNIDNKYVSLYNRSYDFQVNLPNENTYYSDELNTIGTWTYVSSAGTYYYLSGSSATFLDRVSKEILLNKKVISTYSILGNYYEKKYETITVTSSPTGNYSFFTVDKVIDGFTEESFSFQSDGSNPVSVFLELDSFQYFTKIRINSTPKEELQSIISVKICDDIFDTNSIELATELKTVSNQFVEYYCQQDWNLDDENGNSLVYLPKKKVLKITLSNPKQENVWISEIEIYCANYTTEDKAFVDDLWRTYNENIIYYSTSYGPNIGFDVPSAPVGRATWWNSRLNLNETRQQNITTFINFFSNQDIVEQVNSEGDLLYNQYQKNVWRLKYEDQKKKYVSINESINSNAIQIVNNNNQLIDYERYI
jgi:hypothetical protein